MTTVAVIGLGAMGGRMARRFLEAGCRVVVWNRSRARADQLVALGAERAATPAEAAGRAQAVITVMSDPRALRAAHTWLADADDAGWGTSDYTAVLEHIITGGAGAGLGTPQ
jgi:3-hydroxyisobutyrate dehydrogenase-like beta-hydroxyacid dehydrogenase